MNTIQLQLQHLIRRQILLHKAPVRRIQQTSKSSLSSSRLLEIYPEVQEAIQKNKPIVALESTILSHGLPYPDNLQLSKDISKILRSKDVIPATIAVKNGICQVGLSQEDICDLVVSGDEGRASKCSTRDLPFLMKNHGQEYALKKKGLQNDGKYYWGGKI